MTIAFDSLRRAVLPVFADVSRLSSSFFPGRCFGSPTLLCRVIGSSQSQLISICSPLDDFQVDTDQTVKRVKAMSITNKQLKYQSVASSGEFSAPIDGFRVSNRDFVTNALVTSADANTVDSSGSPGDEDSRSSIRALMMSAEAHAALIAWLDDKALPLGTLWDVTDTVDATGTPDGEALPLGTLWDVTDTDADTVDATGTPDGEVLPWGTLWDVTDTDADTVDATGTPDGEVLSLGALLWDVAYTDADTVDATGTPDGEVLPWGTLWDVTGGGARVAVVTGTPGGEGYRRSHALVTGGAARVAVVTGTPGGEGYRRSHALVTGGGARVAVATSTPGGDSSFVSYTSRSFLLKVYANIVIPASYRDQALVYLLQAFESESFKVAFLDLLKYALGAVQYRLTQLEQIRLYLLFLARKLMTRTQSNWGYFSE